MIDNKRLNTAHYLTDYVTLPMYIKCELIHFLC
jgi:hypothetical protein